jgi:hypothetical protein
MINSDLENQFNKFINQSYNSKNNSQYFCCTLPISSNIEYSQLGTCVFFTCQKNINNHCEYMQIGSECLSRSQCESYYSYYNNKCNNNNCEHYGNIATMWKDDMCINNGDIL